MFRKLILIVIIIFILILGVGTYFYFFSKNNGADTSDVVTTLKDFFPFGNNNNSGQKDDVKTAPEPEQIPDEQVAPEEVKLHKLSTNPVSGYALFNKVREVDTAPIEGSEATTTVPKTESVLAIRYGEKATANIFDIFPDTLKDSRMTNTTIPRVYEAFYGNSATQTLLRYLDDDNKTIETYFANIPKEVLDITEQNLELTGSFLPQNILDLSVSPDTKKIFYLSYFTGNVIGSTANIDGTKKVDVFTSAYYEWLSQWIDSKKIALTTKASGLAPGFAYILDTSTKNLTRVLGDIYGLTTLFSPDGNKILYTQTSGGSIDSYIYNINDRSILSFGLKTLPEKCVWSLDSTIIYCAVPDSIPPDTYPDSWYQGTRSFNDSFWKISVGDTVTSNVLFNPSSIAGSDMDGIKLQIDPTLSYLFFVDKKSSILWEYDLRVAPIAEEPVVPTTN